MFLSLVQDFMYLENPDGYFSIIGIHTNIEEAEATLLRQGQRYPGMVVEIIKRDQQPLISSETNFSPLSVFELYMGNGVVFTHGPSIHVYDRIFIYECINEKEILAAIKGGKTFGPGNVFSFIAKVCFLGDIEKLRIGFYSDANCFPLFLVPGERITRFFTEI